MTRWPIHPAPIQGEALSSWIKRLAIPYGMTREDLLEHGLGLPRMPAEILDIDPPPALLVRLEQRTGVSAYRIRWMALSGAYDLPIIDNVASTPVYLKRQPDVEFDASAVRDRIAVSDRFRKPWGCEACLRQHPNHVQLHWKLPWTATCPKHRLHLRPIEYVGHVGLHLWRPNRPKFLALHLSIDTLTVNALLGGHCALFNDEITGPVWLGMLQALIVELNTSARQAREEAQALRKLWDLCNLKPRAGVPMGWDYEELWPEAQVNFLSAAAVALDRLNKMRPKRRAPPRSSSRGYQAAFA